VNDEIVDPTPLPNRNAMQWNHALEHRGLPGRVAGHPTRDGASTVGSGRVFISRELLFELADGSDDNPHRAMTLLWNSLAWGAGTSARNMNRRLDSVAAEPRAAAAVLVRAAGLSRMDAEAAYLTLRPKDRNLLPFLGPAFFSKYLYFAGGGNPEHPCLILDARVANSLRRHGWESLRTGGAWPPATYRRYCEPLKRWASEASTSERPVAADDLEFWLFQRG
jgi:8-oxoguanine DNA glycosylase-like protein